GNPLVALLVRVEAAPPAAEDLARALTTIQQAQKADTSLGEHLDGLYATACGRCGGRAVAEAFLWERGSGLPLLRDYACPHCGHAGREPTPQEEIAGHLGVDAQGLYRRLVGERLRAEGASPRLHERLLALYTPRNLYALTALLLKIDLLFAEGRLRDALRVALLEAMDQASKLYQAAERGWQPVRSLEPPRQYREANVWRAFCQAVRAMSAWPRTAPIALGAAAEGVEARLAMEPLARASTRLRGQVALALSQLPRFDPTFAALSYLWSGWLLGREGSRAAAHLLPQRAPEKARYLRALRGALAVLEPTLAPGGWIALVFQAPATRYLESLLVAGAAGGLPLVHAWHGAVDDRPAGRFAVRRAEHHVAFGRRQLPAAPIGDRAERVRLAAVRAAVGVLTARGEPAPFTILHGPIWSALAREGLLGGCRTVEECEALRALVEQAVQQGLEAAIGSELTVLSHGGDAERATWWLPTPPPGVVPLAERVEASVRGMLRREQAVDENDAVRHLAQRFTGALAPAWPLVKACLEAYGEPHDARRWVLAEAETPAKVLAWRAETVEALVELGRQFGYEARASSDRQVALEEPAPGAAEGEGPHLAWLEGGKPAYEFWVRETAAWAGLRVLPLGAAQRVLVIPERRVALWRHKLEVAPQWSEELARGRWAFLRQAALAGLRPPLDRARFAAALGLAEPRSQLQLFS
ncbi:MAG: hypothetical protein QME94_10525, partial [Anaerolineae bacterium]|nr:hypothetical protein [Anaerolineae bacterium]